MPTLIWTRGASDWDQDRKLLKSLVPPDWHILHVPCVRLRPCQDPAPRASGGLFTHVIITSPHTVEFGANDPAFCQILATAEAIYTHGPKTAEALSQHGWTVTLLAHVKTAEALGAALLPLLPAHAPILLPGPREPAFDLAGYLVAQGRDATPWICYETESLAHDSSGEDLSMEQIAVIHRTAAASETVVCFASPSAITGWRRVFPDVLPRVVTIGPTTGNAAQKTYPRVAVATLATLADLIRKGLEVAARS